MRGHPSRAVLLLQSWVSCEGEDSSAGCPVPLDAVPWMCAAWAGVGASLGCGSAVIALACSRR